MKRIWIWVLFRALEHWWNRTIREKDSVKKGYYWGKYYDIWHLLEDHGAFTVKHKHAKGE